jgi:hypothetical protein
VQVPPFQSEQNSESSKAKTGPPKTSSSKSRAAAASVRSVLQPVVVIEPDLFFELIGSDLIDRLHLIFDLLLIGRLQTFDDFLDTSLELIVPLAVAGFIDRGIRSAHDFFVDVVPLVELRDTASGPQFLDVIDIFAGDLDDHCADIIQRWGRSRPLVGLCGSRKKQGNNQSYRFHQHDFLLKLDGDDAVSNDILAGRRTFHADAVHLRSTAEIAPPQIMPAGGDPLSLVAIHRLAEHRIFDFGVPIRMRSPLGKNKIVTRLLGFEVPAEAVHIAGHHLVSAIAVTDKTGIQSPGFPRAHFSQIVLREIATEIVGIVIVDDIASRHEFGHLPGVPASIIGDRALDKGKRNRRSRAGAAGLQMHVEVRICRPSSHPKLAEIRPGLDMLSRGNRNRVLLKMTNPQTLPTGIILQQDDIPPPVIVVGIRTVVVLEIRDVFDHVIDRSFHRRVDRLTIRRVGRTVPGLDLVEVKRPVKIAAVGIAPTVSLRAPPVSSHFERHEQKRLGDRLHTNQRSTKKRNRKRNAFHLIPPKKTKQKSSKNTFVKKPQSLTHSHHLLLIKIESTSHSIYSSCFPPV